MAVLNLSSSEAKPTCVFGLAVKEARSKASDIISFKTLSCFYSKTHKAIASGPFSCLNTKNVHFERESSYLIVDSIFL